MPELRLSLPSEHLRDAVLRVLADLEEHPEWLDVTTPGAPELVDLHLDEATHASAECLGLVARFFFLRAAHA